MKIFIVYPITVLTLTSLCTTVKAQLFLALCFIIDQYPITAEVTTSVKDLLVVKFDIEMIPTEYFFNLTRTNNITIAARDSDSSKSFEVRPTDNIIVRLSPPTQGGGAHISISGFRENVNYTVRFQFNNTNELRNASDQFTLLTTSVKKITAGKVYSDRATILCHFISSTLSNGCLVQWRAIMIDDLSNNTDIGEVVVQRNTREANVSAQLSNLQPNTKYAVEAFSLLNNVTLHSFGIPLEGDLVTLTLSQSTPTSSSRALPHGAIIATVFGITLFLLGVCMIGSFGIKIVLNIRKSKRYFNTNSTTTVSYIATMIKNDREKKAHSFAVNSYDSEIPLEPNVCYETGCCLEDAQEAVSNENTQLDVYDDLSSSQSSTHEQTESSGQQTETKHVTNVPNIHLHHFQVASRNERISTMSLECFNLSTNDDSATLSPEYENVEFGNGSPKAPSPRDLVTFHDTSRPVSSCEEPERATLPLVGIRVHRLMPTSHFTTHGDDVGEPAEYEIPVATFGRGQKLEKVT